MNLSTLVAGILGGWACVWSVGWACSWPTWWTWAAMSFFLGTSLLIARTFFGGPGPDSVC